MKTKVALILVLLVLVQIMSGCNEENTYKNEVLQRWEEAAGDGYSICVFIKNKPIPNEIETMTKLKKYKKWSSLYTYRFIDDQTKIDYLKAFNEKAYPFYLIVAKTGIVLKTTSVNDVVHFFEKSGGGLHVTN